MNTVEEISRLHELQRRARASLNALFQEPATTRAIARDAVHSKMLAVYASALRAIERELGELDGNLHEAERLYRVLSDKPDFIDYANELIRDPFGAPFAERLSECVWDAVRHSLWRGAEVSPQDNPHLVHTLEHAAQLFDTGVAVLDGYAKLLRELTEDHDEASVARLDPTGFGEFGAHAIESSEISAEAIIEKLCAHDQFSTGRTFRPFERTIRPGPTGQIRALDAFYGYTLERDFFESYFSDVAAGGDARPLLLAGMPGIGKTHLTIARALSEQSLTLVLPDAEYLQKRLEWLMDILARHHYRKFVLFFDDIEVEKVDWTAFRNQVDGFLPQAENVCIVIATNGEFPAPIKSRCRSFSFREMDPDVCQEFIADYLEKHRWMSQPYPDLVSTVASDFVSKFKRGTLNELTPRSLITYLETLEKDKDRIKRLIRESLEDIVRVPSDEPFLQSNRAIINQLRESRGLPPLPDPAVAEHQFRQAQARIPVDATE